MGNEQGDSLVPNLDRHAVLSVHLHLTCQPSLLICVQSMWLSKEATWVKCLLQCWFAEEDGL